MSQPNPTTAMTPGPTIAFDSASVNAVSPTPISSTSTWQRIATVDTGSLDALVGFDIFTTGTGVARYRLTRAAVSGGAHGPLQTDFTQVGLVVRSATINTGTSTDVNAPPANSQLGLIVWMGGSREIGVEAIVVSGAPLARVVGQLTRAKGTVY